MGFDIGGIFKSLVNPATLMQLAMGPAGWAQIAMKAIISAVGQQLIQVIGEKLGLPQQVIDVAKTAFTNAAGLPAAAGDTVRNTVGQLAQQTNMSPAQQGQVERSVNQGMSAIESAIDRIIEGMKDRAKKDEKGIEDADLATIAGKGGFLTKLALILGAAADEKMQQMSTLGDKIAAQGKTNQSFVDGLGEKPDQSKVLKANDNSQKMGTLNSLLQATSQELGIIQNVIASVLKSVGEAQSTVARKG